MRLKQALRFTGHSPHILLRKTLAFLVTLLIGLPLFAATLRVNNAPGTSPDHATIQAAINAASDGDTILIEGSASTYAGFTLTNKRLNLIGPGHNLAANPGTPANKLGAVIAVSSSSIQTTTSQAGTADGTLVMGLEFLSELRLESCANVTVSRCAFNSQSGSGRLYLNGPTNLVSQSLFRGTSPLSWGVNNTSGNRIENCIIADGSLSVGSSASLLYLRNNILFGVSAASGTAIQADNNLFLGTSVPTSNAIYRNNFFPSALNPNLVGSGNVGSVNFSAVMPAYQSSSASPDGRYQLSTGISPLPANPALNAGTDGTHVGPFGGPNPYVLSGVPPLPTIDEISAPQFAAPGSSLTIRVKVGARP